MGEIKEFKSKDELIAEKFLKENPVDLPEIDPRLKRIQRLFFGDAGENVVAVDVNVRGEDRFYSMFINKDDDYPTPLMINNDHPEDYHFDADFLGHIISSGDEMRKKGTMNLTPDIIGGVSNSSITKELSVHYSVDAIRENTLYNSEMSIKQQLPNFPKESAQIFIMHNVGFIVIIKELAENEEFTDDDLFDILIDPYSYDAFYNSAKSAPIFVEYTRIIKDGRHFYDKDPNEPYISGEMEKEYKKLQEATEKIKKETV